MANNTMNITLHNVKEGTVKQMISEEEARIRGFKNVTSMWALMVRVFIHFEHHDYQIHFKPTEFRLSPIYVHVYILFSNLLLIGLIPGIILLVLNYLTYKKYFKYNLILALNRSNPGYQLTPRMQHPKDGNHTAELRKYPWHLSVS